MSVKPVINKLEVENSASKTSNSNGLTYTSDYMKSLKATDTVALSSQVGKKGLSFTGVNPIVGLMDTIDRGGFAASFIIQDGIGFIVPRVGKGLLRGGPEKRDESGNVVVGKDGKPEHELNWALARKELLREIITGPSAFLIPLGLLKGVKHFSGAANNVKMDYIDSFAKPFTDFMNSNIDVIKSGSGEVPKVEFYKNGFVDMITNSINPYLADAEKLPADKIVEQAEKFANLQMQIEKITANKDLSKGDKANAISKLGGTVEDAFMRLKKNLIGGAVDEMSINMTSSTGEIKRGSISEFVSSMQDYYDDALKYTKKLLNSDIVDSVKAKAPSIEEAVKAFTHKRMGTRLLTNLGLFGAVAAFYTQIPKLYNAGLKGNPALQKQDVQPVSPSNPDAISESKKDVAFTGLGTAVGDVAQRVNKGKVSKYISDMFELNGPVISGGAMATLLYGFCIPPRLQNAQDKYDFGEIVLRDMTAFTTLLFGAKALARLSSDLFTKITGLALNSKELEGKNAFKKLLAYVQPSDAGHSVLSSKQLTSKYTNIHEYKDGVIGFMDFIEHSGGNIKKAFAHDKDIKVAVEEILTQFGINKSYKDASVGDIRKALSAAYKENGSAIKKFNKLFEAENGLLRRAKTCNSTFGFLSTLVLVPGLIMWLTNACEKMTANRIAKEQANKPEVVNEQKISVRVPNVPSVASPSMAGFLGKSVG